MKQLLFVYGTLRSGVSHPMARLLARHATLLGSGTLHGSLYSMGHYPGVVVSGVKKGVVIGDLYSLKKPAILRRLDRYEGCAPDQPHPHEFRRAHVRVRAESGMEHDAWVYLFNRPLRGRRWISSGDWLNP